MRLNEHCKLSWFTQITANFIIINVLHPISLKDFLFHKVASKKVSKYPEITGEENIEL